MARGRLAPGVFLGALSRSLTAGAFQVDLRVATLGPEEVQEHSHADAHFLLALDEGYRSIARDPLTGVAGGVASGTVIYNPPGVEHRDCFDEAGGRFLSVSVASLPMPRFDTPVRLRASRAGAAARRLVGLCIRSRSGDAILAEGATLALAEAVSGDAETSRRLPGWLRLADEAMADRCREPGLEVRAIAAAAGVHPVHLARAYRLHFGCSPGAAIRRMRMDRAIAALAAGVSIADVAAASGYADQSHLTRECARAYGAPPGAFRAALA